MTKIERFKIGPRMSRAVTYNSVVYLAGITADDLSEGVAGQMTQVLRKADQMLSTAGTSKARLLMATIWLRDISDFDQMNVVWESWIDPAIPPARATAECKLADAEILVEVILQAAL